MSDVTPVTPSHNAEAQVYLAVERTFLAWIRTGLALMGLGFVVARFGLFLQEIYSVRSGSVAPQTHGMSTRFGTALVILGVVLLIAAMLRYVQTLRRLANGERLVKPSRSALVMGTVLALLGSAVAGYLLLNL